MPTDLEVLSMMIGGGERLCDDALNKEIVDEKRRWWWSTRRKIRIFAREIREWLKSSTDTSFISNDDSVTNEEVLQIMIDGGENLCDNSLRKWSSHHYGEFDGAFITEQIQWWVNARRRVRELAKEIQERQRSLERKE